MLNPLAQDSSEKAAGGCEQVCGGGSSRGSGWECPVQAGQLGPATRVQKEGKEKGERYCCWARQQLWVRYARAEVPVRTGRPARL